PRSTRRNGALSSPARFPYRSLSRNSLIEKQSCQGKNNVGQPNSENRILRTVFGECPRKYEKQDINKCQQKSHRDLKSGTAAGLPRRHDHTDKSENKSAERRHEPHVSLDPVEVCIVSATVFQELDLSAQRRKLQSLVVIPGQVKIRGSNGQNCIHLLSNCVLLPSLFDRAQSPIFQPPGILGSIPLDPVR